MRLIITEKPAVAQTVATVVGAQSRKEGYREGNGYVISWCIGHLVGLAEASAYDATYQKWNLADLPIIPPTWQYEAAPATKKQLTILKQLMKRQDITDVVNACDAGREGELIFRHVYAFNQCQKPMKRLWISSLEAASIQKGLANLHEGSAFDNLYQAALCRSQADWLIGINATRLYSLTYHTRFNIGRVMTPTLALITSREATIQDFVQEEFYKIELQAAGFKALYQFKNETDKRNPSWVETVVADGQGKPATVTDIQQEVKRQQPPPLFDLTSLQREANQIYGLSAQKTLDAAQALYEAKLITYPRTDASFLSDDLKASTLELLANVKTLAREEIHLEKVVNNQKVTDHHAIIPTQAGMETWQARSAVTDDASYVLQLIAQRLITAVHSDHMYEQTTVTLSCGGHPFITSGRVVVHPGFKAFLQPDKVAPGLPPMRVGDSFEVLGLERHPYFSQPPASHTEASLLLAMERAGKSEFDKDVERKGLGTPATRAGIIEKLLAVGYIQRKGKSLLPTHKGIHLINSLPEKLTSVTLTSDWENQLKKVEKGDLAHETWMKDMIAFTQDLVSNHQAPSPETLALLAQASRVILGQCPRCGGGVVETPKAFSCEHTRAKQCQFVLWKEHPFLTNKKKKLTQKVAQTLLADGQIDMKGLHSQKTGKTYDATLILEAGKEGPVRFKMAFNNTRQKVKKGAKPNGKQ